MINAKGEMEDCVSCAWAYADQMNYLHCDKQNGKVINDNQWCGLYKERPIIKWQTD